MKIEKNMREISSRNMIDIKQQLLLYFKRVSNPPLVFTNLVIFVSTFSPNLVNKVFYSDNSSFILFPIFLILPTVPINISISLSYSYN
jgi:hypothetical protein